jgi:hypothetical protein
MSPRGSKTALTVLVTVVIAGAGLTLLGAGAPRGVDITFLAWFVSCLAGEMLWIRTPTRNGTISMALALDLAVLIALPAAQSLPIVAASAFLASLYPHRRRLLRASYNAAQSTLAAGAALLAIRVFGPADDSIPVLDQMTNWPGLFAGGAAFFLVNSGLVAGAIALETRRDLWSTWRENFAYSFELATTAAQVSLAGFILIAYQQMGPMAVVAILPVLGVLWWSSAREADMKARRSVETTAAPGPTRTPAPGDDGEKLRRAG